jgi:hypothetical protein
VFANGSSFYLSIQGGLGSMQTPKLDNPDNYDIQNFAWRYAGCYLYAIDKMEYGVELGYNGYEDNTYGKTPIVTEFHTYSTDLLTVIRYNFYQRWRIFTEIGAAQAHLRTESTTTNPQVQQLRKILPELAFGFGYGFTKHIALDISFNYELGRKPTVNPETYEVTNNQIPTTSSILAGLTYTF